MAGETPIPVDRLLLRGILVTTAFLSLPVLLPGALGWLHSLIPLPVFYYLMRAGYRKGSGMVAGALLLTTGMALILGTVPALLVPLVLAPLGYALAWTAQRGESPLRSGLEGVILLSTMLLLTWLVTGIFSQVSSYAALAEALDKGLLAARDLYRESAQTDPAALREVEAVFSELRELLARILPSLILMFVIGTVWLNMVAGNWLLKKKTGFAPWPPYRQWRLPDWLVWGVVLSGTAILPLPEMMRNAALNLMFILGLLYFFQGLAVTGSLLGRWSVPSPLQAVIYFLLFIQVYGVFILIVLGLLDVWLNLRKQGIQET
jgi:uncharacterized protein YybS (DUF2232 family)